MSLIKHITVANKIATYSERDGAIVCDNSDYKIAFTFDTEWDEHEEKTARFIWKGKYVDKKFTGTECEVPKIQGALWVHVGVYAGDLETTTPANIPCKGSILGESSVAHPEQLQEYRDAAAESADRAEAAADRAAEDAAEGAAARLAEVIAQEPGGDSAKAISQKAASENFANALKGRARGAVVCVNDVSPVEHTVGVRVHGKNTIPYPYKSSSVDKNGGSFAVQADGGILASGTPTDYISLSVYTGEALRKRGLVTLSITGTAQNVSCDLILRDANANTIAAVYTVIGSKPKGTINLDDYPAAATWAVSVKRTTADLEMSGVVYPQIEEGDTATEYEPFLDPTTVRLTRYGASETDRPETFTPNADGTVDGVTSLAPTMTLLTDTEGVTVELEYNQDISAAVGAGAVELKKIVTSNNYFTGKELVKGYYFDGRHRANAGYNYFKNIRLTAGTYKVHPRARFISNLTTGEVLGADRIEEFTVEAAGLFNITVFASEENWKLYKAERHLPTVMDYGEVALAEDVQINREFSPLQSGLVERKNFFNGAEIVTGYYWNLGQPNGSATASYNYFKNIILPAGTYKIFPKARFVSNLTANTEINANAITEFTLGAESLVYITVYASDPDWKLYKSEHSIEEVESCGEYRLKSNIVFDCPLGNILTGKKWYACGDSFTAGGISSSDGLADSEYKFQDGPYVGKQITYPYIIGQRNAMAVVNLAVGGMTMCNIDGARENAFSNGVYLNVPADADYITLKFGINDINYNSPLGTIDDETTSTFYGAWNVTLRHLLTKYPYAKIGIIITNGCGTNHFYTDATREIAKKWGIAYIDEVNDPTVPLLHRVDRAGLSEEAKQMKMEAFRVSETNTHPNVKAHYYEATFIENWLRSL